MSSKVQCQVSITNITKYSHIHTLFDVVVNVFSLHWLLALRDNSQQVDKIPTNPPTGTGYTYELGTRHQPTPAHSEHSREEV